MKSINFKKIIWRTFLLFWNMFALIGLCVVILGLVVIFDDVGYCLSTEHGVWDSRQKICRKDCIKWDEVRGCLKEEDLVDINNK